MADKARFVQHKGKRVCLGDVSDVKEEKEILSILPQFAEIIFTQSPGSVLALLDITNAGYTVETVQKGKEGTKLVQPYIKAMAVVGATGVRDLIVKEVNNLGILKMVAFDKREEAMDWLIKQ